MKKKESTYNLGMKTRREVLGNQHVDNAEKNKNSFNEEFQEFITRYAWGEIWSRKGLDRKTRSCMTLVMMMALNRQEEYKMHLRAAINNGLSRDEIKETILHAAIYLGLPASNEAFKIADKVLNELGAKKP